MEQKELFERVLKVLAHAAAEENKKQSKYTKECNDVYFAFRNYVYNLK